MIEVILLFIGVIFLVKGSDYLVEGSSSLAKKFGISTLIIGLTIVAFGTSTPELVVSIIAAMKGSTEIAFGNIIGSNMANILLVLGVVALISPLKIERSTVWKEIPFALLAVVVLFIVSNYLLIDKINITSLTRVSGLVMLCFFVIFIYYTIELAKQSRSKLKDSAIELERHKNYQIFLLIAVGLLGLYLGGKWTVEGAIFIASKLGLSEFLISVTVVAIGTSLPELMTGITAARKGEAGMAVGGSVGSNIFNVFWILGITSVIAPVVIPGFINLDMILLIGTSLLLFLFMFIGERHKLQRWQGGFFILLYIAYMAFVVIRG